MVGRFGRPTGFPEKHYEFRERDFLYSQVIRFITFLILAPGGFPLRFRMRFLECYVSIRATSEVEG